MLASELIDVLKKNIEEHGDCEVTSDLDYVITGVLVNNDRDDLSTYFSITDDGQTLEDYQYFEE